MNAKRRISRQPTADSRDGTELAPFDLLMKEFDLSARQAEVAALLAQGLNTAAIAARFHRSSDTIHEHIAHIYRAMAVSNRWEFLCIVHALMQERSIKIAKPPA